MKNIIPYPLRATRLSISINPFNFWKPCFKYKRLPEKAKREGDTIWWARFAWIQISYSRWM